MGPSSHLDIYLKMCGFTMVGGNRFEKPNFSIYIMEVIPAELLYQVFRLVIMPLVVEKL